MAQMYAAVEKGYPAGFDAKKRDHEISVTLARVLFLLFGDDTEMWKRPAASRSDLFQDFIKDHTARDGSDIAARAQRSCFEVLDTPPADRGGLAAELAAFPYVNGGIFEERSPCPTSTTTSATPCSTASAVDWSTISPAIFGSMFQSVRDAQTRRELGEHYTSEENILKTLNPLFLDELRAEFDAHLTLTQTRSGQRTQRSVEAPRRHPLHGSRLWLRQLHHRRLPRASRPRTRIMDALRDLSTARMPVAFDTDWTHLSRSPSTTSTASRSTSGRPASPRPRCSSSTASATCEMKERFGEAPERLPIQRVGQDRRRQCASGRLVAGLPAELRDVDHRRKSAVPRRTSREPLSRPRNSVLPGARHDIGRLDYVTGWYAKAMDYFAGSRDDGRSCRRTRSPKATRSRLFGPMFGAGWRIKFAHRTFAWTSEATGAAAVHCVIVGFDRAESSPPRLFEYAALQG